jgi:hypothetical protein
VVTTAKGTTSYVTVRGSIPLYWQEGEALVTLKPKPHVIPGRPHLDAMVAHLRMLAALYGPVLMLSLIDAHGNEANIHRVLSSFAVHVLRSKNGAPSASGLGAFVPFDFHAECGKSASALGMYARARCGQCPQDHGPALPQACVVGQRSDVLGSMAAGKRIAQLINDQGPWLDPANFFFAKAPGSRALAAHSAGGSPDARHDVGAGEACSGHGAGAGEGDIDGGGEAGTARAGEVDNSGAEGDAQAWDQAGDEHPRSLSPGSKLLQESRALCAASIRKTRRGTHAAGSVRVRSSSHAVAPMVACAGGEAMPPRWQEGVARVNCIDCLDRTNVVQAAICLRVFVEQLRSLEELDASEYEACQFATRAGHSIPLPAAESGFKHLWANNGDALSLQYAGTGALKGDFTRKGKRTMGGILADLGSNVKRAMQNNFADVYRQRVIDMLHGQATTGAKVQGRQQEQLHPELDSSELAAAARMPANSSPPPLYPRHSASQAEDAEDMHLPPYQGGGGVG